jgi:hypothetical protein
MIPRTGSYGDTPTVTRSTHAAAQLREHFLAGITLHAIQPAAVHRGDGALDVNQIVFTQSVGLQRTIVTHGGAIVAI